MCPAVALLGGGEKPADRAAGGSSRNSYYSVILEVGPFHKAIQTRCWIKLLYVPQCQGMSRTSQDTNDRTFAVAHHLRHVPVLARGDALLPLSSASVAFSQTVSLLRVRRLLARGLNRIPLKNS